MNFIDFTSKISIIKTSNLGGLDAQFLLAPKLRLRYDAQKIAANNPRKAAVLALFYPNENHETTFLLTQRASYNGTHSAQISFPGGKVEQNDTNLQETALRETTEEVGISSENIEIIRELTDVYIPPSNFLATPFIGIIKCKPVFVLNREVDKTIEVLLSDLLNNDNITSEILDTSYMKKTKVPCFRFDDFIIWGATAMILSEIKELLK